MYAALQCMRLSAIKLMSYVKDSLLYVKDSLLYVKYACTSLDKCVLV
jgi:hypothetical protein